MSVKNLIFAAAGQVGGDYQIERSLRFNSADSAYLSRTPASAGNRKTWTWSGWVKRARLGTEETLFACGSTASDTAFGQIVFSSDNKLRFNRYYNTLRGTNAVYRDVSAWYHIVVVLDTPNATAADRAILYVNNERITSFEYSNDPTQNTDLAINQNIQHTIGRYDLSGGGSYLSAYLTDINFIDGQALTPSSFGEVDSVTGVWKPIAYAGTYGTNGFHLDFSDNSSTTALGYDAAGSNDWTPNNFSVAAGAGNDSLVDTPTQYGTDTGAGGEVRGNYATLNAASPLATGLANGNLQLNYNATNCVPGTLGVTSGKWYWEGLLTTQTSNQQYFGVANENFNLALTVGQDAYSWGMTVQSNASNGKAQHNNVETSSYATFANTDICMVAYDVDAGKIWFGRNGTWFNSGAPASGTGAIYSNLSGTIVPMLANKISGGGVMYANFGQRPFAYTAPSGFKALCTTNLPEPTVVQGDDYFNTVLYTGNNQTPQSITGVGFQPDWVWIKSRSYADQHILTDAVRGTSSQLSTSQTAAETTRTDQVTSFDSDGFSLGVDAPQWVNYQTQSYVAWNWKANGAGSSNTDGSITSTVSVNQTAGFSIVSYTGTGTTSSVGHGLGTTPAMVIVKSRTSGVGWPLWHQALGGTDKVITLNTTGAVQTISGYWGAAINSTVFGLISGAYDNNRSGDSYIAYCFAEVPGYSAFGSYTGNGSADGPFVYTGFRPAFVIVKPFSGTSSSGPWWINDSARDPYNVNNHRIQANASDAEATSGFTQQDFLSNGFKWRNADSAWNGSGTTYIYMAFAENPFKNALAR